MENLCPNCGQALMWESGVYVCNPCDNTFIKQEYCKTCSAQLEKLQACGSTSYFCHQCDELKSRSMANIVFEAKKTVS